MTRKAYQNLWMLRRLKKLGAENDVLLDLFEKRIRCHLEYVVPVWQGSITKIEKQNIERVQKVALHIILGDQYTGYSDALKNVGFSDLESRRISMCQKFAKHASRHKKHKYWFKTKPNRRTRPNLKYYLPIVRTERLRKSAIPYMTNLLNSN